jgi:hypothetical protein
MQSNQNNPSRLYQICCGKKVLFEDDTCQYGSRSNRKHHKLMNKIVRSKIKKQTKTIIYEETEIKTSR